MEITKINVPVKVINAKCLKCPCLSVVCNEVTYGKDVKQYVYECKNLKHCIFMMDILKSEQKGEKAE